MLSILKKLRIRDYLILLTILAVLLYVIINQLTLSSRIANAVTDNTIDTYDAIFSRHKMINVHDSMYSVRRGADQPTVLSATYQLTAQETEQLLSAKHILNCEAGEQCTIEDIAPVLNSLGDYKTVAIYSDWSAALYIDSKTNKASWIFGQN